MAVEKTLGVISESNLGAIEAATRNISRAAENDPQVQLYKDGKDYDPKLDPVRLAEAKARAAKRDAAQREREEAQGKSISIDEAKAKTEEFDETHARKEILHEDEPVSDVEEIVQEESELDKLKRLLEESEKENLRLKLQTGHASSEPSKEEIMQIANASVIEDGMEKRAGMIVVIPAVSRVVTVGHKKVSDGKGGFREEPNVIHLVKDRRTYLEKHVFDALKESKGILKGWE